ncbi:response regulator [Paraburkholderia youngii]|uniref:response regulator n=1 Tax=Paraburkholderia youngii TaxID=2782701 RepID=UPI0015916BD1|nr:response regulator [Paraburkholderia youngii]NUX54103.1 response regulator [Paraburkholderia youngii]
MNYLRKLFVSYEDYCNYRKGILKYAGLVGTVGYPVFYLIYKWLLPQPYNSLSMRLIASAACAATAIPEHWPDRLKKYYFGWAYATVLYCLPFFHVFMSLKNHGNLVFIADSFMAVFFLVLLTDWRNTVTMLCVGAGLGVALYMATTDQIDLPMDYVARLPTFILVVVGGSLFKFSERQLQDTKLRVATALAGSIAHEMRTPLSRIQYSLDGASRSLPEPTTDVHAQALTRKQINDLYGYLSQGQLAVNRGLQVIAMTLDEVNAKSIDTSRFVLIHAADVVHKALAEYAYETEEERGIVSASVVEDFVFRGDETLFIFVLFNLLKNALYYHRLYPGMKVTVTVQGRKVCVSDTGPGIPQSVLPRLFDSFQTSGKAGGTGLGLAYCKRVITAFNGDISCDSVEGEGSQFTLRFPGSASAEEDERARVSARDSVAILAGKRVLIVDDDSMQRIAMRRQLTGLGMEIDEAHDGQGAIDCMRAARYDLVVMDLTMPVLDGYATTRLIRSGAIPGQQSVPVLACTSEPPHLVRMKVERAGMSGMISKPYRHAELVRALRSCLERSSAASDVLAGKTAILADDDESGRRIARGWLEKYGIEVIEANHGQQVLDMITAGLRCDVILLDLNMPGLGGLETTRAIRSCSADMSRVPVIALTGYSDAVTVESARNAGMNDVMTKPVRGAVLFEKLRQQLCSDGAELQLAAASAVAVADAAVHEHARAQQSDDLLDLGRLQELKRDGQVVELLGDYLLTLDPLIARIDASVASNDLDDAHEALHSLLGVSGNIGGAALHRLVRRLYVPVANERRWPTEENWLNQLRNVTVETVQMLRQECPALQS